MRCPCKDCYPPKRKIGCHGVCEGYKAWQEQEAEKKAKVEQERVKSDVRSNAFKKFFDKRKIGK